LQEKEIKKRIRNFLNKYKHGILLLTGVGIFINIFLFLPIWDLLILLLIGLWIISIWLYKFEGRVSVFSGIIFLSLCPFLLLFGQELIAEKSAVWFFMFLLVGVIQMIFEYIKEG